MQVVVSSDRQDLEDQARQAFRVRWPELGEQSDTLCIMAAAVAADAGRKGLAGQALTALRERAAVDPHP